MKRKEGNFINRIYFRSKLSCACDGELMDIKFHGRDFATKIAN